MFFYRGVRDEKNVGAKQLAVRVDDDLLVAIDKKRMEMAQLLGTIPTRSDVVRVALEKFLNEEAPQAK